GTAGGIYCRTPRSLERRYRGGITPLWETGRQAMQRRNFLTGTLATSALAVAKDSGAQTDSVLRPRLFYQLRRYSLQTGPQVAMTEKYISEALIPALSDKGGPVGAFRVEVGPETPALYVLIPTLAPAAAGGLELELNLNESYIKAAEPFWSAPATSPAFLRIESSLLVAFEGWPRITAPAKGRRIFQLRTYESPSYRDHLLKIQMFHSGEFELFKGAGFQPVFFGDTLIGPRMPSLTYMLAFADYAELDAKWNVFRNDGGWKKLSTDPK